MTPTKPLGRPWLAALAAVAFCGATAAPSTAHSIGADVSGKSTWEFLPLGVVHMLLGWDHLLFIAGVVLLAWNLGRAAKLTQPSCSATAPP